MNAEQNVIDAPTELRERRAGHDTDTSFTQAASDGAEGSGQGRGSNEGGFELDENGQRIPHGMGQSKSSRRRRRKRKNKGPEGGSATGAASAAGEDHTAAGGEPDGNAGESSGIVASVQAASPQGQRREGSGRSSHAAGQNQGQNQGANQPNAQNANAPGTKRWKKKFRDRERGGGRNADNIGNVASGSQNSGQSSNGASQHGQTRDRDTHQPGNSTGSFKRKGGFGSGSNGQNGGGKGQQRGPRSFVGPMDHSYRAVNGNYADTSPSTIEPHGNYGGGGQRRGGYQGDSQPIDYSQGRSVPIPENTPTHIYFFIEDLFITAKIQETARKLGVKVAFVKNDKEAVAALTATVNLDRPSLIVFDLNNANAKPMTLIPKLKTKLKKTASIIGFLSHLQGDLKAKAVEAGCDTVMPRAAFSQNLPNLLRRYGIEETEEANFNQ